MATVTNGGHCIIRKHGIVYVIIIHLYHKFYHNITYMGHVISVDVDPRCPSAVSGSSCYVTFLKRWPAILLSECLSFKTNRRMEKKQLK